MSTAEREASDWLVRRAAGALPAMEEGAFQHWLAVDSRNAEAFESLTQVWGEVGELNQLASLVPLEVTPVLARRSRLLPLGLAAAALVIAIAAVIGLRQASQPIATQLAEIRDVMLSDGSVVTLGAQSALDVRFDARERRVVLKSGEGFFKVRPDALRAFIVEADAARIRVLGTQFNVQRGVAVVRVSVAEGSVEISGHGRRVLKAGEKAEVNKTTLAVSPAFHGAPPAPNQTAAWRFGRLVYDDGLLEDLVADVNRYYAPGVALAGPELGKLRVTAAFRTDEISPTIGALARALPIAAEYRPDGHIVLKPRL